MSDGSAEFDVLIVGAGLSGIGAAARLTMDHPDLTFALLDMREVTGGTWDLFRYPGIRSDSDMLTLGYRFRPWLGEASLARGGDILDYVRATAEEYDVDRHIRFGHRVTGAGWDSGTKTWTVECSTQSGPVTLTASFLWSCTGYYDYAGGHRPDFPNEERFVGPIVHPQEWPEDLDYSGKRIAVIGSGATAITLVPALAETARHVTMVQRSPTYVVTQPEVDRFGAAARRFLPGRAAHVVSRAKNIATGAAGYGLSRRYPDRVRRLLESRMGKQLPPTIDVATHFSPRYNPWDQRICLVPDGDLFAAFRAGSASVVTGEIATFSPTGLTMANGEEIAADIIVTATGLRLLPFGGIALSVDDVPVDVARTFAYRAMMLSGVPNFVFTIGYTNASWTLKADLVADFACRLLTRMRERGYRSVVPVREDSMTEEPLLHFSSGYVVRSIDDLPKQGPREPWRLGRSYLHDAWRIRRAQIEDGVLQFRS